MIYLKKVASPNCELRLIPPHNTEPPSLPTASCTPRGSISCSFTLTLGAPPQHITVIPSKYLPPDHPAATPESSDAFWDAALLLKPGEVEAAHSDQTIFRARSHNDTHGTSYIGQGSSGSVEFVRGTTESGEPVVLTIKQGHTPAIQSAMRVEAEKLYRLNQAGVPAPQCLGYSESVGLVTTYAGRPLTADDVKDPAIKAQLLQLLVSLEKCGLMHQDLKPENLCILNGIVNVIDIGQMEVVGGPVHLGTLGYSSPYQIRGGEDPDIYPESIDRSQIGTVVLESGPAGTRANIFLDRSHRTYIEKRPMSPDQTQALSVQIFMYFKQDYEKNFAKDILGLSSIATPPPLTKENVATMLDNIVQKYLSPEAKDPYFIALDPKDRETAAKDILIAGLLLDPQCRYSTQDILQLHREFDTQGRDSGLGRTPSPQLGERN